MSRSAVTTALLVVIVLVVVVAVDVVLVVVQPMDWVAQHQAIFSSCHWSPVLFMPDWQSKSLSPTAQPRPPWPQHQAFLSSDQSCSQVLWASQLNGPDEHPRLERVQQ